MSMAASVFPLKEVHVQELAIKVDVPPTRYIRQDKDDTPFDASVSSSIPIIDLHLLSSPSSSLQEKEMEKLRSALSTWGFFQAIGHNMPSSLLDEVRTLSKEFFDLPMEEKHRYSVNKDGTEDWLEGYGNEVTISEEQVLEWSDRLYLLVRPHDQRSLNLWPNNPHRFREVLDEYSMKVHFVAEIIFKSMAKSIGLDENYFLHHVGENNPTYARFNYYPPCPKPDSVYGIKPHTDGGAITIVLQDEEVEGLEVLKDGHWIKVPVVPHALVINLADQIEHSQIMSNGVFKSAMHRVITNSKRERISVAVFYVPEEEKVIEPAVGLITESRPKKFNSIKAKDYGNVHFQKYSRWESAIDWARV